MDYVLHSAYKGCRTEGVSIGVVGIDHLQHQVLVIVEVGLCFGTSKSDCVEVVGDGRIFLLGVPTNVFLLVADVDEYLPTVSVLRDTNELRSPLRVIFEALLDVFGSAVELGHLVVSEFAYQLLKVCFDTRQFMLLSFWLGLTVVS